MKYRKRRMSLGRYLFIRVTALVLFFGLSCAMQQIVSDALIKSNPIKKYAVGLMLDGAKGRIMRWKH